MRMDEEIHRGNQGLPQGIRSKTWISRNNLRLKWNRRCQNISCLGSGVLDSAHTSCKRWLLHFKEFCMAVDIKLVGEFTHGSQQTMQVNGILLKNNKNKLLTHINNIEDSEKFMLRKTCMMKTIKHCLKKTNK